MKTPSDFPAAGNGVSLTEGLGVRSIQQPVTPVEVSELLRAASDLRHTVVPFGGKLSLSAGNVIPALDLGIDMTGLTGVHSYLPADLTLSVASGTTFAEIRAVLGEHGQELPLDVPHPERATIGGLIATGFAGPRRFGFGSLKDLIIGCEFVRGDGLLGHAGGMVVKNVSGFEIPRFLHGSWGSLAVLTSVNLKVMPKPRSEATLVISAESMASGVDRSTEILALHPSLAACTVTRKNDQTSIAVRIMGREKAVEATIQAIENTGTQRADCSEVLDSEASRQFWQSQVDDWAGTSAAVLVSTGTRPRDVKRLISAIEERFGLGDKPIGLMTSPGTGSVRFRFDPTALRSERFWETFDLATLPDQTVAYIETAPATWKGNTNVWRNHVSGDPLMMAVKQQFDPQGILNPGRLFI